jgi:hypothetical protein
MVGTWDSNPDLYRVNLPILKRTGRNRRLGYPIRRSKEEMVIQVV